MKTFARTSYDKENEEFNFILDFFTAGKWGNLKWSKSKDCSVAFYNNDNEKMMTASRKKGYDGPGENWKVHTMKIDDYIMKFVTNVTEDNLSPYYFE